ARRDPPRGGDRGLDGHLPDPAVLNDPRGGRARRGAVVEPARGGRGGARRRGAVAGPAQPTASRMKSMICWVVAPGVKISATPSFLSSGMSSAGMVPPTV